VLIVAAHGAFSSDEGNVGNDMWMVQWPSLVLTVLSEFVRTVTDGIQSCWSEYVDPCYKIQTNEYSSDDGVYPGQYALDS
jgi:hypothetical protein